MCVCARGRARGVGGMAERPSRKTYAAVPRGATTPPHADPVPEQQPLVTYSVAPSPSIRGMGESGEEHGTPRKAPVQTPKKTLVHNVYSYDPRWEDRRRHPEKTAEQARKRANAEQEALRAIDEADEKARKHTGPLTENISADQKFRYGEIFFEETGKVVPYFIAPEGVKDDHARKAMAEKLITAMVKNKCTGSKKLSKPNIIYNIHGHGRHYFEWAKEVYENEALSQAWNWCTNSDRRYKAASKIQALQRGRNTRRVLRFVSDTCKRALVALITEVRLSEGQQSEKDLLDAAEGKKGSRPYLGPLDEVSFVEWRLHTEELDHKKSSERKWRKGSTQTALKALSKAPTDQRVWLRSKSRDKVPEPRLFRADEARVFLTVAGRNLTDLRQEALEVLQIEKRLVEFYSSTAPAMFRAVQDNRPSMFKAVIGIKAAGTQGQDAFSAALTTGSLPDRKGTQTQDHTREDMLSTASKVKHLRTGKTLLETAKELNRKKHVTILQGPKKQRQTPRQIDRDQENKPPKDTRTESLWTRAERLGCNPENLISDRTRGDELETIDGLVDRIVDRIVDHSWEAIDRRTRRRKERLREIDFTATQLQENVVEKETYEGIKLLVEPMVEYIDGQVDTFRKQGAGDSHQDAESAAGDLREAVDKATCILKRLVDLADSKDLKKIVHDGLKPDSDDPMDSREKWEEWETNLRRKIHLSKRKSDSKKGLNQRGAEASDRRLEPGVSRLLLLPRWKQNFRDLLREKPALGATLGLPLDLDNSAFERIVDDIRSIRLEQSVYEATTEGVVETIMEQCASEQDPESLSSNSPELKRNGCDLRSVTQHLWNGKDSDLEHQPKACKTIQEYLEWLRKNTLDVQKVETYFKYDHSEGTCLSVEDELRKELKKLPLGKLPPHMRSHSDSKRALYHSYGEREGHPEEDAESDERDTEKRSIPLDRAMIEFGDRMLAVFTHILTGVINSEGWLICPADRGPVSQLIGETIGRLDGAKGELKDLVWIQYAALRNPRLGGAVNHEKFVQQLRDASVELGENGEMSSGVPARVFYPSDRVLFPTTTDMQGHVFDESGREVNAQDWMREKVEIIEDQKGDLHLHPRCSHLIFWDTEGYVTQTAGTSRVLEQPLPHDQVEALDTVLREEGVAHGLVLVNGDERDLELTIHQVTQSDPVLCLQCIGGASDFVANIFNQVKLERVRQRTRDVSRRRAEALVSAKKTLHQTVGSRDYLGRRRLRKEAQRYNIITELQDDEEIDSVIEQLSKAIAQRGINGEEKALIDQQGTISADETLSAKFRDGKHLNQKFGPHDGHKGRFHFNPRALCVDQEMCAISVASGLTTEQEAGHAIQMHLAEMLTMQNDEREQMLGWKAAEHQRLTFGWDQTLHYEENAVSQEVLAHLVQILMLVINLALVVLVVFKQAMFPSSVHAGCGANVHEGEVSVDDDHESLAELEEAVKTPVRVAFKLGLMVMPVLNGILLTLDSAFSPTAKRNALRWSAAKIESEIYMYRARAGKYSPVNTSTNWCFMSRQGSGSDERQTARQEHRQGGQIASKTFVETIHALCEHLYTEGVFISSHLNYADEESRRTRRQRFLQDRQMQRFLKKLEEADRTSELEPPRTEEFYDNGYQELDASQYIACRTEPLLVAYKQKIPNLGHRDMIFVSTLCPCHFAVDSYLCCSELYCSYFLPVLRIQMLNRAFAVSSLRQFSP